jgi:hypothetical protein
MALQGPEKHAASGAGIIAGRIDLLIDNVPNSIGQIFALAVIDNARDPALPYMPRCGSRTPPVCARR